VAAVAGYFLFIKEKKVTNAEKQMMQKNDYHSCQ